MDVIVDQTKGDTDKHARNQEYAGHIVHDFISWARMRRSANNLSA